MSPALDYEQIAHLYDSYMRFTDDLPFLLQECRDTSGSVLELMCGTGRVSIPLNSRPALATKLRPTAAL
jgi:hypothetical protein